MPADVHQQMVNVTSRLAVKVKYLPDVIIDWSDATPQRSRSTHHWSLSKEADSEEMYTRAVEHVMRFMATHFWAFTWFKMQMQAPPLKSPPSSSEQITSGST